MLFTCSNFLLFKYISISLYVYMCGYVCVYVYVRVCMCVYVCVTFWYF
jgi:hypothetical protein